LELPPHQDHPKVKVPPPLIFFALLCIACSLEYWFSIDYQKGSWELRGAIALVLFIISGYLALNAFMVLKKWRTFVDPNKPTTQIVDEGPFRFSRNPMYLSLVVFLIALSVLFLSIWFFLSAIILWLLLDLLAVTPEEEYLAQKFDERYAEYKSRVRRWI
jgi:protein-S-isoprenylcysteine O-methyltransferase Ste14